MLSSPKSRYRNLGQIQVSISSLFETLAFLHPASWFKFSIYALLLVSVYFSAFTHLVIRDWARGAYTYAYMLPFVVLYLIWVKRAKLVELNSVPSWMGTAPLILGLVLFWLGELGMNFYILYISFWLVLVGLCWMHLGWQKIKAIAFVFVVSLTMFPIPSYFHNNISVELQLISSQLSAAMIRLYGMPAFREGNVINLGFAQLQVVEACSGLRYLFPLIVLGLLLAYFYKAALWKRITLVISMVPLAIFANGVRIALTGILYDTWGAEVAEAFFHGFSGWLFFMLCLVVVLAEMWILGRIRPSNSGTSVRQETSMYPPHLYPVKSLLRRVRLRAEFNRVNPLPLPEAGSSTRERELRRAPLSGGVKGRNGASSILQPQFIVAVVLLGTTFAFAHGCDFRKNIPLKKSFAQLPVQLLEWTGTRQSMEERFLDKLRLSDYALIDYFNREGKSVYFFAAYYESQLKSAQVHSPAICLRGSGWILRDVRLRTISAPEYHGGTIRVSRVIMHKPGNRQLCYYWFPQRGRILTNNYELKILNFWDALTRQRTDGALVRVITPIYEFEQLEDAEARLQRFTRAIVPVLEEYIPGREIETNMRS